MYLFNSFKVLKVLKVEKQDPEWVVKTLWKSVRAFYLELGWGGSLSADDVLHGQPGGEESPVGQAGQLASTRAWPERAEIRSGDLAAWWTQKDLLWIRIEIKAWSECWSALKKTILIHNTD